MRLEPKLHDSPYVLELGIVSHKQDGPRASGYRLGCGYLATTTALMPGGHAMRLFALQSGQDTSRVTSGASVLIISFITLNGAAQAMQSKSRSNFCLPSIRSPRQWAAPPVTVVSLDLWILVLEPLGQWTEIHVGLRNAEHN